MIYKITPQYPLAIGLISFNTEIAVEIIKFQLMKNKMYIICLASNKKVSIYNVLKLKKICEFYTENNNIFELLEEYDLYALKTWFMPDIKLGMLSVSFSGNNDLLYINTMNFDMDYLEKIIEKTNNFSKKIPPPIFFTSATPNEGIKNYSSSMGSKQKLSFDKSNTLGYIMIKLIFSYFVQNCYSKYTEYFENYFYDTKGFIKRKFLSFGDSTKPKSVANVSNYFIYSTYDNLINVGPFIKEVIHIPNFLKDNFQIVN